MHAHSMKKMDLLLKNLALALPPNWLPMWNIIGDRSDSYCVLGNRVLSIAR